MGSRLWHQSDEAGDKVLGLEREHWEGSVLSIETTHLEAGVIFTMRGYPISRDARITERYTRDDDKNLHMELVVYAL